MSVHSEDPGFLRLVKDRAATGSDVNQNGLALIELFQRLHNGRERELQPGSLAQWKAGLKNRKSPAYGEPVVVITVLDQPAHDSEIGSGSPYFRESLDILVGEVEPDGEFLIYHCDRRRFEPYGDRLN